MAKSSVLQNFHILLLIFSVNSSFAQRPVFPNSIVLPVSKDESALQYVTKIQIGAPRATAKLVLDLGGQLLWVDSDVNSLSSSQNAIQCSSLQCSMAQAHGCGDIIMGDGFGDKICILQAENGFTKVSKSGDLVEDTIAVRFRDGSSRTGEIVNIPNFLFSSASRKLLDGLASGVKGSLGLGNSRIAFPSQLSTRFGFQRRFALCLTSSNGVVLAGDGPYVSLSGNDIISRSLVYTPLVPNQIDSGYFINVKSIKVNSMKLPLNSSILNLDENGNGGVKISTTSPYATLHSSIYEPFVKAYAEVCNSMNMARVAPVAPFDVCFSSKGLETTWVGPNVPILDFVLQSEMVKWRVHGRNSMVQVSDEVMCLGFLNGGLNQKASIVIGGYQLEENLLEFNLGTSMLGFASLLTQQRTCSDFGLDPVMSV